MHQAVLGSTRYAPVGAYRLRDADPAAPVEVTVVLRRAADGAVEADPVDVAAVEAFAAAYGLTVLDAHAPSRAVRLAGNVASMNEAFHVDLGEYSHQGRVYRGREGDLHVPEDLAERVVAVLGLDERSQARATPKFAPHAGGGYAPNQVAQMYGFPAGDGTGQTIAVIELGGGYRQADLQTYFSSLGLKTPSVTAVSVGGAANAPGQSDADVEVALDVEVIGAVAQGAAQLVYFAPNTDQGFYNAIAAAIHDSRRPSVISISWGGPESSWTSQAMKAFDSLFADAGAAGVTVFAAAGDSGSSDGTSSQAVDFPASSPNVVACGGTTLTASSETVWNDGAQGGATGGGVSGVFPLPAYQQHAGVPGGGRGVPDVAGDASPTTGYLVYVGGQSGAVGGTSAVAPLWAALTAISNQINNERAGDIHQVLYANPAAFNDITSGSNGAFQAAAGWDACTGLGSPKGAAVVAALAGHGTTGGGTGGGGTGGGGTGGGGTGGGGTGGGGTGGGPVQPPAGVGPILLALLQEYRSGLQQQIAAVNQAIKDLGGS